MTNLKSLIVLGTVLSIPVFAQMEDRIITEKAGLGSSGPVLRVMGPGFGVEGRMVVTSAPFTADAITQHTRTLADGTHITNSNTTTLARDSEGRVRREQTLSNVGQWSTGANPPHMVFISDPVAKTSYMLQPDAKKATKSQLMHVGGPQSAARPARAMAKQSTNPNVQTEDLGSKVIEGVNATGRRMTRTIPAGTIGNDRPLVITEEVWTSPELHMVVMSHRIDPETGETTYTLTNIRRAEPDPTLFTVPSDYTVTDGSQMKFRTQSPR